MSIQPAVQGTFSFFRDLPIVVQATAAQLTTDAGLLPIREFDDRIGLTEAFAAVLDDPRDRQMLMHTFQQMARARIAGILADYVDQNDHDTLRSDPVFKLIADRLPDDPDLASQPTLSRFENAASIADLWRLRDTLVDVFLQSFDRPPGHLTLDLDPVNDPAHGEQQLTMFNAYYDDNQYLPIVVTCAENDRVILVGLRHGTCEPSLGVDEDLRYLAGRLR